MPVKHRPAGRDTKAEAQRVALALFTTQGYRATSLREIADALGITKASLYYHFRSKEEIVRSLVTDRAAEARALLDWVTARQDQPDLARAAVLRWIESTTAEKLQGVRFVSANPTVLRELGEDAGAALGSALEDIVRLVSRGRPDPARRLLLRAALLSINCAASVAQGAAFSDDDIIRAAREMAGALLDRLDQSA